MGEWLKANGGPAALVMLGVVSLFVNLFLGLLLVLVGGVLWLNHVPWFPLKVIRESNLRLTITDAMFTTDETPPGSIQVTALVLNKGTPTTLHSWELELRTPERTERGIHLAGAPPKQDKTLKSLSEGISLDPLGRGSMRGYVSFGLTGLANPQLSSIKEHGILVLSVSDQTDRRWKVEQDIASLEPLGETKLPPEQAEQQSAPPAHQNIVLANPQAISVKQAPGAVARFSSGPSSTRVEADGTSSAYVESFHVDYIGPPEHDPRGTQPSIQSGGSAQRRVLEGTPESYKVVRPWEVMERLPAQVPTIFGYLFRYVAFEGPALIAILPGCEFIECGQGMLDGNVESVIWEFGDSAKAKLGPIGLQSCRFEHCLIDSIGFTAPPEALAQLREALEALPKR